MDYIENIGCKVFEQGYKTTCEHSCLNFGLIRLHSTDRETRRWECAEMELHECKGWRGGDIY